MLTTTFCSSRCSLKRGRKLRRPSIVRGAAVQHNVSPGCAGPGRDVIPVEYTAHQYAEAFALIAGTAPPRSSSRRRRPSTPIEQALASLLFRTALLHVEESPWRRIG